jgi:predicted ATPase/DNA-binding CsgD family transcriptional regulator/DNA-binding XRE family transcriptional regulator
VSTASSADRPAAHVLLRALRRARGVTQEEWARSLGYSPTTVRRWESGAVAGAPSAQAEEALIQWCEQAGLFRQFEHGPLGRLVVTPRLLREALGEARLQSTPAPSAVETPPVQHNLPVPLAELIGRDADLLHLRQLLPRPETGVLTLVGTGGVGKTRLALQLAHAVLQAFRGGVWWIELAPLVDPDLVVKTTASVLGIQEHADRPLQAALIEFLRLRPAPALLIFDNCEHLLGASATLVSDLVTSCPELRILATSREPLHVSLETIWRVPPLATEGEHLETVPAVRLFVERARTAQPDFELGPRNGPAIAEICTRLDGLPLAIELAAVRVRVLSVQQIATRLDDAFRLLVGGSRDLPMRQQTLEAALDWSYALLTEPEQALLRRLAVCAGGFDLDAAEAVGSGSPIAPADVLALLTSLIDKSLIHAATDRESARYRFLEPVRQYASARLLASADPDPAQQRHAEHYLHVAEVAAPNLFGPDQHRWFDHLEQEHDNLRQALRWSQPPADARADLHVRLTVALGRFWLSRCHFAEGSRWLQPALAIPVSRELASRRLLLAGLLARYVGDFPRAVALLDECRHMCEQAGDAATAAWACAPLGAIYVAAGDLDRADEILQAGVILSRAAAEPRIIGVTLGNLAEVRRAQQRYPDAIQLYQEALVQARLAGDPHLQAGVLGSLGQAVAMHGDRRRAVELLLQSLDLAEELADERRCALDLEALAALLALEGRALDAVRLFGAARAWRDRSATLRELPDEALHAIGLSTAREKLGPTEFAAAFAAGRLLVLASAVGSVRSLVDQLRTLTPAAAHFEGDLAQLTPREREVVDLLASQLSNRAIAERLGISEGTARIHVARVLDKLGIRSRHQVAALARPPE